MSTPPTLSSGADTIPFTSISWTSTSIGNGGAADMPSGTFGGSSQTLRTVAVNTSVENCLIFRYANGAVVPAGSTTAAPPTPRRRPDDPARAGD